MGLVVFVFDFGGEVVADVTNLPDVVLHHQRNLKCRDEDPDPVILGPPDPVLFSTDPDPDPTCNNGFIKLFLSLNKI